MNLAIVSLCFREEGNQSGSRRLDMFLPVPYIGRILTQKHET